MSLMLSLLIIIRNNALSLGCFDCTEGERTTKSALMTILFVSSENKVAITVYNNVFINIQ